MADTPLSQKVEDLPAGHVQHRSDDAVRSLTFDAGEARETCPPLARQEICLQPVLPLVRGDDPLRTGLSGHRSERGVTRVPGAGFRGKPESPGLCPGVAPPEEAGEPEPPRVLPHEREVPVRLPPPPAVVDVGDGERPAGCANAFRRAMKKRHGVGAPRNGQQMRAPRRHQSAFSGLLQSPEDGVHQLMVRRSSPAFPSLSSRFSLRRFLLSSSAKPSLSSLRFFPCHPERGEGSVLAASTPSLLLRASSERREGGCPRIIRVKITRPAPAV